MSKRRRGHTTSYLLPDLLRTLLSPRITVRYPFEPMELPDYFRGKVTIDQLLCRGCGACVRDCPANALELERESRDRFRMTYWVERCAFCGQCEISCPFDAITLTNELASPSDSRDRLRVEFEKREES